MTCPLAFNQLPIFSFPFSILSSSFILFLATFLPCSHNHSWNQPPQLRPRTASLWRSSRWRARKERNPKKRRRRKKRRKRNSKSPRRRSLSCRVSWQGWRSRSVKQVRIPLTPHKRVIVEFMHFDLMSHKASLLKEGPDFAGGVQFSKMALNVFSTTILCMTV